ncbi:MAG: 2-oxoacid:acceptor oxidoreductase family protein [Nitrospiraceae bacterium]|nr:2-oxoacid:acceptor oxidoreductase family protein [Nitrospiraceae bacterium]
MSPESSRCGQAANDNTRAVLLAGSGGQGILFAGKLLAQAALDEDKNVTWFPSYGAEVRGGTANCTVVISGGQIGSPIVGYPDVLVILNNASLNRFTPRLKPGGALIVNTSLIDEAAAKETGKIFLGVPAGGIALKLGDTLAANMVMLGAAAREAALCGLDALKNALRELAAGKKALLELNLKALDEGWNYRAG